MNCEVIHLSAELLEKAKKNKIGFLIPFWNIQSAKFKLQKCALVKSF